MEAAEAFLVVLVVETLAFFLPAGAFVGGEDDATADASSALLTRALVARFF